MAGPSPVRLGAGTAAGLAGLRGCLCLCRPGRLCRPAADRLARAGPAAGVLPRTAQRAGCGRGARAGALSLCVPGGARGLPAPGQRGHGRGAFARPRAAVGLLPRGAAYGASGLGCRLVTGIAGSTGRLRRGQHPGRRYLQHRHLQDLVRPLLAAGGGAAGLRPDRPGRAGAAARALDTRPCQPRQQAADAAGAPAPARLARLGGDGRSRGHRRPGFRGAGGAAAGLVLASAHVPARGRRSRGEHGAAGGDGGGDRAGAGPGVRGAVAAQRQRPRRAFGGLRRRPGLRGARHRAGGRRDVASGRGRRRRALAGHAGAEFVGAGGAAGADRALLPGW